MNHHTYSWLIIALSCGRTDGEHLWWQASLDTLAHGHYTDGLPRETP